MAFGAAKLGDVEGDDENAHAEYTASGVSTVGGTALCVVYSLLAKKTTGEIYTFPVRHSSGGHAVGCATSLSSV